MRALSNRRAPALFLGVSLAGFAAAACGVPQTNAQTNVQASTPQTAPQTAPLRCEIALDETRGSTRIEGRVLSDTPVHGTYAMAITSRGGGGQTTIRQSGDFDAAPGTPALLGETHLGGAAARHDIDLRITVAGRTLSCAPSAL